MWAIWGDLHLPSWANTFSLVMGLLGEIQGKPRGSVGGIVGERLVSAGQSREGGFPNPPPEGTSENFRALFGKPRNPFLAAT